MTNLAVQDCLPVGMLKGVSLFQYALVNPHLMDLHGAITRIYMTLIVYFFQRIFTSLSGQLF